MILRSLGSSMALVPSAPSPRGGQIQGWIAGDTVGPSEEVDALTGPTCPRNREPPTQPCLLSKDGFLLYDVKGRIALHRPQGLRLVLLRGSRIAAPGLTEGQANQRFICELPSLVLIIAWLG